MFLSQKKSIIKKSRFVLLSWIQNRRTVSGEPDEFRIILKEIETENISEEIHNVCPIAILFLKEIHEAELEIIAGLPMLRFISECHFLILKPKS